MKSILKWLYELFFALFSRRTLGSTFISRFRFIRHDKGMQVSIEKKFNIHCGDAETTEKGKTGNDK